MTEQAPHTAASILIADDQPDVLKALRLLCKPEGYQIQTATSPAEVVETINRSEFDLVLMDIILKGDMNGIEAAELIRKEVDIPIVYLTAYSDEAMIKRIKKTEPGGYIAKPFDERAIEILGGT